MLVQSKSPVVLPSNGTGYEFFITDVVSGRIYAESLINQVIAAGMTIIFSVLYPDDIGLGKAGTIYSEISYIYGEDPTNVSYPTNDLTGVVD